jgi:hypothetical protein
MRLISRIVAASAVLLPLVAHAGETKVPANRTSLLGMFNVINTSTCGTGGKPEMEVLHKPAHGRIEFRWVATKLGKGWGVCGGRPAHAMQIFYTPDKGFRGVDKATIGMRFQSHEVGSQTGYQTNTMTLVVQ